MILIPIPIIGSEIIPGWFGIGLVINILTIIVLFLAAFTDIHKKWEYRKYLKNAEIYNVKVPELQKEADDYYNMLYEKYQEAHKELMKKV